MNELIQTVAEGFVNMFGNYFLAGVALLMIVLVAMARHGFHLGTAVVISVPLVLALAMSGNLPQGLAFATLFGVGLLVFYVIYPIVSGGERP